MSSLIGSGLHLASCNQQINASSSQDNQASQSQGQHRFVYSSSCLQSMTPLPWGRNCWSNSPGYFVFTGIREGGRLARPRTLFIFLHVLREEKVFRGFGGPPTYAVLTAIWRRARTVFSLRSINRYVCYKTGSISPILPAPIRNPRLESRIRKRFCQRRSAMIGILLVT